MVQGNLFVNELLDEIDSNIILILCSDLSIPDDLDNPQKLVNLFAIPHEVAKKQT